MEDVEQERDDALRRRVAVDLGDGLLERRRPVLVHPQRLPVEHGLGDGQRAHRVDDPRQRAGDVVEVAGVDPDLVVPPVDLDPDPVELPFH